MNSKSFIFIVLLLAFIPSIIARGSLVGMDIDTLWEESELAVLGKVTSVKTQLGDRSLIYRIVTIQVEAYYIRAFNQSTVKVRIEGGQIGPYGLWVEDQPEFKVDELVFVFLKKASSVGCDYGYTVKGLYQGKFTVDGFTAERSDGESFSLSEAEPMNGIGEQGSTSEQLDSTVLPVSILVLLVISAVTWAFYRKSY